MSVTVITISVLYFMYLFYLFICILSAFPPQIIQVQPQVIEILAGETSILFCNASRQITLSPSTTMEIFWLRGSNEIISTTSDIIIAGYQTSTTNLVITSSLTFTRVRTSQAGTYTCVVNMTIPRVVVDHQVARSVTLNVQRE